MSSIQAPTEPAERIVSMDALRGVAVLGILVINVRSFAMPEITILNPTAFGDFSGANYWAWVIGHVLFELKFITLFSILFGAGVALFMRRRGGGDAALRLHFRRTGWLIVFGLAHAYLIWYGDILVAYGVCALWVVFLRDWGPRATFSLGIVFIAVPSVLELVTAIIAAPELIADQWRPVESAIRAEIEAYRGGWIDQLDHRVPTAFERQTAGFIGVGFWRVGGSMLVGFALFDWGVLTDEWSHARYRRLALGGVIAGLVPILVGVAFIEANAWSADAALFWRQFNYWGSLPLAGGYIGLVYLFCRARPAGVLTTSMAAVGRTAFTNYLLQSVIATSVFYGHGLGLFGRVSRIELLAFVVAVWVIQVSLSVWWLRRYRFGPIEWLWRTLTYGERQPVR